MCGFVGFSGKLEHKKEILNKMMARIVHRGPDSEGEFIGDDIALGFRRLSIIDLEGGSQPIYNEDGSVVIVYNGEVYNFKELRAELEADGHVFTTDTDTEALVHGYEKWGSELAKHLRGMYAFVIYDKNLNIIYGARDIFGIKPFYYYRTDDGDYIFGSEIKAFLEHPKFVKALNRDALRPYLTFQYSSLDETFFEGVYKLPPAHSFTLTLGSGDELMPERYWDARQDLFGRL